MEIGGGANLCEKNQQRKNEPRKRQHEHLPGQQQ